MVQSFRPLTVSLCGWTMKNGNDEGPTITIDRI
jgi:hypothetical protein